MYTDTPNGPFDVSDMYPKSVGGKMETVDHPAHYGGDTPYEVIKVLASWMTPEEFAGFCLGNVIKYVSRAGKKTGGVDEDLRKARWYLDYYLEKRP